MVDQLSINSPEIVVKMVFRCWLLQGTPKKAQCLWFLVFRSCDPDDESELL